MKQSIASVDVGDATVDTLLQRVTVRPGEAVDAAVSVEGGDGARSVGEVVLELQTRCRGETGAETVTVDRLGLGDGLTVDPGESTVDETTVRIPYATPLTMDDVPVWAAADFCDPEVEDTGAGEREREREPLAVRPTARMETVFDAADALGLSIRGVDCETDPYDRYVVRRYVQVFEFSPVGGPFEGAFERLSLVFDPAPEALTVYAELDRTVDLLSALALADERKTRFALPETDADAARRQLRQTVERLL
ncbi:sporulation protein [Halosimplex salinum]|uniref:sporulation protein n=1 Tax=Halosimplex salinum TaxID=1710538 RepID=UPI000F46DEA0|nr:sporulation protein [Halosimplex salinum]